MVELDGLGRGNQAMLFEDSERVFDLRNRKSIRKIELGLILGGSCKPKANLGKIVFLGDDGAESAGAGSEMNVLSGLGNVKTEIGDVVTAIVERRIGVGFRRSIEEIDTDMVGYLIIDDRNGVSCVAGDVGVGFVGPKIGFD
mgnify:CR=1 FL=1